MSVPRVVCIATPSSVLQWSAQQTKTLVVEQRRLIIFAILYALFYMLLVS